MSLAVQRWLLINLTVEVEKLEVVSLLPDALRVEGLLAALIGAEVERSDHRSRVGRGMMSLAQRAEKCGMLVVELREVKHKIGCYGVKRGQHVHPA
jgi:hypothetical protein